MFNVDFDVGTMIKGKSIIMIAIKTMKEIIR